jgi:stage II sporulation protein D
MVFRYKLYSLICSVLTLCAALSYGGSEPKERAQDPDAVYEVAVVNEQELAQPEEKKERTFNVRILLDEHDIYDNDEWAFQSDDGFLVSDELIPTRTATYADSALRIGHARGSLYINERRCVPKKLHVIPRNGKITINDSTYQGSMLIVPHKESWLLINVIDLEEYIYSVLKTESWPGWPIEVNKAFAITSRTYAIAMIMRAQTKKTPYHMCNTNVHQTYTGIHDNPEVWRAVLATRGLFLGHDNKPILAMFDACCGGIIPAHIRDFDFKKAPYLAREYPCTHCKRCKIFNWEAIYEVAHLEKIIKEEMPHITKLKKVEIAKRDRAGLTDKVVIISKKGNHHISGKKWYSLLRDVKSFVYEIEMHKDVVHIKGRGYGHHLGLCQWGAREMVRDGADYRKVLDFYYPGTCLMKLI